MCFYSEKSERPKSRKGVWYYHASVYALNNAVRASLYVYILIVYVNNHSINANRLFSKLLKLLVEILRIPTLLKPLAIFLSQKKVSLKYLYTVKAHLLGTQLTGKLNQPDYKTQLEQFGVKYSSIFYFHEWGQKPLFRSIIDIIRNVNHFLEFGKNNIKFDDIQLYRKNFWLEMSFYCTTSVLTKQIKFNKN